MTSLSNRTIKNSFFNVVGWLWLTSIMLFSIPYMIKSLGVEAYGVLTLTTTVLGYFAFLDLGLTDSVVRFVAEAKSKNDIIYLNQVIGSSLLFYVIIGCIGGIAIFISAQQLVTNVFTIPQDLLEDTVFGIRIASIGFLVNMMLGVINKITEGLQRFDISNKISMFVGSLNIVGSIILLLFGFKLRALLIFNFICPIIGLLLGLYFNRIIQPGISLLPSFSYSVFKKMMSFGVNTFLARLSSYVTTNINNFFVTSLLGASALTFFNVPFRIIGRINAIIYKLAFTLFPLAAELHSQNDSKRLLQVYRKSSRVLFLFSSAVFIPIVFFSWNILYVWLGKDFADQGWVTMSLVSLSLLLISLTMVPSLVANGIGKPVINTYFSSITMIINLITVYPLIKMMGISGAAFSILLSSLQAPLAVYYINKKILNIDPIEYYRSIYGVGLLAAIAVGIIAYFTHGYITNIYVLLVVLIGSAGFISCMPLIIQKSEEDVAIIELLAVNIRKYALLKNN